MRQKSFCLDSMCFAEKFTLLGESVANSEKVIRTSSDCPIFATDWHGENAARITLLVWLPPNFTRSRSSLWKKTGQVGPTVGFV